MGDDVKTDDINEFEDFLAEENQSDENSSGEEGTGEENLDVENPDDESDEGKDESDETGKEGEENQEQDEIKLPKFSEVTKKYPKFFKEFPELRHAFFHAKEYRELFPTVEEAKEAVEELNAFHELQSSLESGEPSSVGEFLTSLKDMGENVLPNLATNFIATLQKIDQNLYYSVITPELVNFTRSMYEAGIRNENENLKNAAMVAAKYFFKNHEVASGKANVNLPNREAPKKDEALENERKAFRRERYTAFYNDTVQTADTQLKTIIGEGLDPKNTMTNGMKDLITEKVLSEINRVLSSSPGHKSRMDSLWRKAEKEGFPKTSKSKITSAFLEAAKEIMPRIRSKIRADVMGIRDRHSENDVGSNAGKKRSEPMRSAGEGRQSNNGKVTSAKQVDWKKTSDLDFIQGNTTLKR